MADDPKKNEQYGGSNNEQYEDGRNEQYGSNNNVLTDGNVQYEQDLEDKE